MRPRRGRGGYRGGYRRYDDNVEQVIEGEGESGYDGGKCLSLRPSLYSVSYSVYSL